MAKYECRLETPHGGIWVTVQDEAVFIEQEQNGSTDPVIVPMDTVKHLCEALGRAVEAMKGE